MRSTGSLRRSLYHVFATRIGALKRGGIGDGTAAAVLAACVVLSLGAARAVPIRPGDTLHLVLPAGKGESEAIRLDYRAAAGEEVTAEAHAITCDTFLRVGRIGRDGTVEPIGEDDDGGAGFDSRLTFATVAGTTYRLEVVARGKTTDGGPVEVSLVAGRPAPLEPAARLARNVTWYDAAARSAHDRGRPAFEAQVLYRWAVSLFSAGDSAAALAVAERLMAADEAAYGKADLSFAVALDIHGMAALNSGDARTAESDLTRALAIAEAAAGTESPAVGDFSHTLAQAQERLGRNDEAQRSYERALAIREKLDGPESASVAQVLTGLGVLAWQRGDYDDARALQERALGLDEKIYGTDHPEVANASSNLAAVLQSQGDYPKARALYERAMAIDERVLGADHPRTLLVASNLSSVLQDLGDREAAIVLDRSVLERREARLGKDHPDVANSLTNLAAALDDARRFDESLPLYQRALAILEASEGAESLDTALARYNIGVTLFALRRGDEARPMMEAALAAYERAGGKDSAFLPGLLVPWGRNLAIAGDFDAAAPLLDRAVTISTAVLGPEHPKLAEALTWRGDVRAARGDRAGALEDTLSAEGIARAHARMVSRSLSEERALRYESRRPPALPVAIDLLSRAPETAAETRRVYDALVRSRALVLDEMAARRRFVAESRDAETTKLAAAFDRSTSRLTRLLAIGPEPGAVPQYLEEIDGARRDRRAAEEALAARSSAFRADLGREEAGLAEAARGLPEGAALLSYVVYGRLRPGSPEPEPTYAVFVLPGPRAEPHFVPLGPARRIEPLVSAWRDEAVAGATRFGRSPEEAEDACRRAGAAQREAIWDPAAALLGAARMAIVVPDGALNLVSFAALPSPRRGRYLLETGPTLHTIAAERDLAPEVPSGTPPSGHGLLAVGGPAYDVSPGSLTEAVSDSAATRGAAPCKSLRSLHFPPLPQTETEVRTIARLWESAAGVGDTAEVLLGTAADEAAVKRQATGRRVLHLATHGFFLKPDCEGPDAGQSSNPLRLAALAFAGANRRAAATPGEEDGILTAEEVASLDLRGVEWAVLSACDTGVGDVTASEGVMGLRRAFRIAGADTVIMSLWPLDDLSARRFMTELYEARTVAHLSTAEAMRRAALRLLDARRKSGESTHPSFWGGFIAAGDWR